MPTWAALSHALALSFALSLTRCHVVRGLTERHMARNPEWFLTNTLQGTEASAQQP